MAAVLTLQGPSPVRPGSTLAVGWSGQPSPAADDWIGVWPRDGADADRIAFDFTRGGAGGSLTIPLPATLAPGQYELRFLPAGGWLATARLRFAVVGADAAAPAAAGDWRALLRNPLVLAVAGLAAAWQLGLVGSRGR